ncbi:MAG: hypothetical protein LCH32_06365 [Bacteroidetes bacterium]|nr:hypothetical protein [Bacteroidota bacterium]
MLNEVELNLPVFLNQIKHAGILCSQKSNNIIICGNKNLLLTVKIIFDRNQYCDTQIDLYFALHDIINQPQKCISILKSKLRLNKTIYARNCLCKSVKKDEANSFLTKYHLLNSFNYGNYYGLHYNNELVAVAGFSKGRKLNCLNENERSFELIRYCCKSGITVTGGLSKLINYFVKNKNAAHIMTYTDNMLGDNKSFEKIGFNLDSEKSQITFNIDKTNFKNLGLKTTVKNKNSLYQFTNLGNKKWVKFYSTQLL